MSPPHASDWARREGAVDEVLIELAKCERRSRLRRRALCGSLVAVLIAAAIVAVPLAPRHEPTASARVAMPERQVLPDGSLVELRDGSSITVGFSGDASRERRVSLAKGEAHFAVAKNPGRPFVVTAGDVEVTAIGTAFSVALRAGGADVHVTEGIVRVTRPGQPPVQMTAGDSAALRADSSTQVTALSAEELTEVLSWRIPQLEFSGTPLSAAVAMFNEHNAQKLVLADETLGDLQVSGYLRADRIETFLLLLETNFALKGERLGREIVIRRP